MTIKKRTTKQLTATAYHEAGHAVIAFFERRKYKSITIIPSGDSEGCVSGFQLIKNFNPDIEVNRRELNYLEKEIDILLAGPVATKLYSGIKYGGEGSGIDIITVAELACYLYSSDEQINAYFNLMYICMRDRLRVPHIWAAIESLSKALLEQGTISYKKSREIIRGAMLRYRSIEKVGA